MAAIACPERFVVGLDISELALKNAVKVKIVLKISLVHKHLNFFLSPLLLPSW